MSNIKLKPCPFCSGEAERCEQKHREYASTYYVRCKKCKVQTSPCIDESIVIEDWNARKPVDNIIAELEKERELANNKALETVRRGMSLSSDKQLIKKRCFEHAIEIVKRGAGNE